jgi:YHS domain-containing protein
MKMRLMGMALAVAALLLARGLLAEDKAADSAGKCPVSGEAASKDHAVDFDGGKVYFCCDKCPKAFAANQKKFAAKAHLQMVLTGQLKQTVCPFTGKPLNAEQSLDVQGVKVEFCCGNCKKKAAAMSEDALIDAVFGDVSKNFKKAE